MKELYYLKKYFFKYRYRFFIGTFFVVISNIFALFPAQYVRKAFDTVKYSIENNQNENLYFEKNNPNHGQNRVQIRVPEPPYPVR